MGFVMTEDHLVQMVKEYGRRTGEFILSDEPTHEEFIAALERMYSHAKACADRDGISMLEALRRGWEN